jgi:guanylate kinase
VDEEDFIREAKRGEIVMPFRFGKVWYGYHRSTWKNIIRSRGVPWVFNVRPYTGLALATALPEMKAVWLDVPDEIRHRRVEARGADRDRERERMEQDAADRIYRDLYPYVIPSHNKEECVRLILEIIE